VRLTLWGFCYTQVTVEVEGDEVPLTGTLKQDDEKQAQYLLVRVCLPAQVRPPSPVRIAAARSVSHTLSHTHSL
jgi:hypothetical protein